MHLYNNQRALYKDPEIIENWFRLIANFIAKFEICIEDIYNFDKTGFLIGIIRTIIIVTSSDCITKPKLVQFDNRK